MLEIDYKTIHAYIVCLEQRHFQKYIRPENNSWLKIQDIKKIV